ELYKKKEIMMFVLDDTCCVDRVTWNTELKLCLDDAAPGSRILVTSQVTNLSAEMGIFKEDTLPLSALLNDDSWSLICET
ncbi:hypothetical protein MKX03_006991, partial [Papaver bracteatum]